MPTPANVQRSARPSAFRTRKSSPGDDVEVRAFGGEEIQDREIGIRLDGVADRMVQPGEGVIEATEIIPNGLRGIDVGRSADGVGNGGEVDAFASG